MINNLISKAKEKNIDIEVNTKVNKEYKIELLKYDLTSFDICKSTNYQIKALYNDKVVNLNYENISDPDEIIKTIISHASLIDNDNKNKLCENDYLLDRNIKYEEPDFSKIKKELLTLNEYREKYPFISNIDSYVGYIEVTNQIDNEKHHMEDKYMFYQMLFYFSAKKGDVTKTSYNYIYDKEFNVEKVKNKLENSLNKLELSLDATSVKTNKYKVLLNNESSNKLISALSDIFFEKLLDMKLSPLSGKLGEKIFSDKITIVEEPVNDKFIVTKHFDKDGVLTYNKVIVENGIFKTALNNLEYALKNNTKPTGNASGTVNLHIKEGNKSYDELVKMLDNGIIINNIEGLHAGINHQTGDISLQSTGFIVENGKIVKALDMIILQTNIIELLTNVIEVGNDLYGINPNSSSVSLLLDNITISGNL